MKIQFTEGRETWGASLRVELAMPLSTPAGDDQAAGRALIYAERPANGDAPKLFLKHWPTEGGEPQPGAYMLMLGPAEAEVYIDAVRQARRWMAGGQI